MFAIKINGKIGDHVSRQVPFPPVGDGQNRARSERNEDARPQADERDVERREFVEGFRLAERQIQMPY